MNFVQPLADRLRAVILRNEGCQCHRAFCCGPVRHGDAVGQWKSNLAAIWNLQGTRATDWLRCPSCLSPTLIGMYLIFFVFFLFPLRKVWPNRSCSSAVTSLPAYTQAPKQPRRLALLMIGAPDVERASFGAAGAFLVAVKERQSCSCSPWITPDMANHLRPTPELGVLPGIMWGRRAPMWG